jgi:hypothetical protein
VTNGEEERKGVLQIQLKKKRVSPPAIRKSGSNKNNTAPIMKFPMIVIKPAFAPIEKKRKSPKY